MALQIVRSAVICSFFWLYSVSASSQVFVVGEKSATADIKTDIKPTHVQLPGDRMTERGRRELIRNLDAEQGFAHLALPVSPDLVLRANGPLTANPNDYKKMLYEKGIAASPGDRVVITAMEVKPDRIVLDFNGGPYLKHRFLRHVSMGNSSTPVVAVNDDRATGTRITLLFEGFVPELTAPEIKALLAPMVDFGVKSSEQAYADTLPDPIKESVAAHEVLVGMNHRMVLAAMGAPESKVRDQPTGDPKGGQYEEWIYGHVPQTIRFVRFVGDRVTMVEIAALGKPIEIHDKDELGGLNPPDLTREIAMGDKAPNQDEHPSAPPTLRRPGEAVPAGGSKKVQFPDENHQNQPVSTTKSTTGGSASNTYPR